VLSFKVAPVLGAAIAVENIEVMDFEVIVHIAGQLHRQVGDLPPGSRITASRSRLHRRRASRTAARVPRVSYELRAGQSA